MQSRYDSHEDRGRFSTVLIAIVGVAIAVVLILVLALSYFSSGYTYGYPYGWGMMGGFMGFPLLFIFPIMLIVLVVIGYRWGGCCGGYYGHYGYYGSHEERETAMEILRRRYANGEITKEQFEQMKKDIVG
jgi:putative membrane protein